MTRTVVVGGSRGIGAAIVERLTKADHLVEDLSRATGVDVTDRVMLRDVLRTTGPVNHLVYCAGHVRPGPFGDVDGDEWDYHLAVNLLGAVEACRWFVGHAGPGSITLVGSTAGTRPSPGWSAYAASKAALLNLGTTLAAEHSPRIRVYPLAVGRCATALRATLAPDEDPATIMQPGDVADIVHDLIHNDTDGLLSGQVVEVKRR